MADCAGLLNRCRELNPYREFESHPLRFLFHKAVPQKGAVFFVGLSGDFSAESSAHHTVSRTFMH